MSTVENAKPVTARPSPSALTCTRKFRSSTAEPRGISQLIDDARPSRSVAMACSIWSRAATSAKASQMKEPTIARSSRSSEAPLDWADRAERFKSVMRPSRSTVKMVIGRASSTWRSRDVMGGMLRVDDEGRKQRRRARPGSPRPSEEDADSETPSAPSTCALLDRFLRTALLRRPLPGGPLLGRALLGAALLGGTLLGGTLLRPAL